jgi:hypothetical protein
MAMPLRTIPIILGRPLPPPPDDGGGGGVIGSRNRLNDIAACARSMRERLRGPSTNTYLSAVRAQRLLVHRVLFYMGSYSKPSI